MTATIREIALRCGVSKSTAMRTAKRCGLITDESKKGSRGSVILEDSQASILAHEIMSSIKDKASQNKAEPVQTAPESVLPSSESVQTAPESVLPSSESVQTASELTYAKDIEKKLYREQRERILDLKSQISDLKERLDASEKELESTRRALEEKESQIRNEIDRARELELTIEKMRIAPLRDRIFGFKKLLPKPRND